MALQDTWICVKIQKDLTLLGFWLKNTWNNLDWRILEITMVRSAYIACSIIQIIKSMWSCYRLYISMESKTQPRAVWSEKHPDTVKKIYPMDKACISDAAKKKKSRHISRKMLRNSKVRVTFTDKE